MFAKKPHHVVAALIVGLTIAVGAASMAFAGNVTETQASCVDASVALLGEPGAAERIRSFIELRRGVYDVAPTTWEIAYPINGVTTAYGVKCHSGDVCNSFAHDFATANPHSSPVAFCGPSVMFK